MKYFAVIGSASWVSPNDFGRFRDRDLERVRFVLLDLKIDDAAQAFAFLARGDDAIFAERTFGKRDLLRERTEIGERDFLR